MKQTMIKLRKQRASVFWRQILPYAGLIASSGLALFLFLFVIISLHYYAELVSNVPEWLPVNWITLLCMWPVLVLNPIRTYLQPADIMFLMPAEHQMSAYFGRTMRISLIIHSMFTLVVWLIVWPLYKEAASHSLLLFLHMLIVLLVMKWTSLYGRWQELQMRENIHRQCYMLIRLVLTIVQLYVLFTLHIMVATGLIAVSLLVYIAALHLPVKYRINWLHLINVEQQHQSIYYSIMSWFVHTPHHVHKVRARPISNRIIEKFLFQQQHAYHYLFLKTFVRTDLYAIVIRLTLLGCIVLSLVNQPMMKSILFIMFMYISGVQLASLAQRHRHAIWVHVYPLRDMAQYYAAGAVIGGLHIVLTTILFIVFLLTMTKFTYVIYSLVIAIIVIIISRKKFKKRYLSDEN